MRKHKTSQEKKTQGSTEILFVIKETQCASMQRKKSDIHFYSSKLYRNTQERSIWKATKYIKRKG